MQSEKGYVYVGQTSDLELRLSQHNKGFSKSTKNKGRFEVVYTEEYRTRKEAVNREKVLKSGKGREFIKKYRRSDGRKRVKLIG